ncbi:MAG: glycosyltransferase, partial [Candidatus Eisenbacteria bacterium]
HGTWHPDHKLRLFRKDLGRWVGGSVHEGVEVEGETGVLRNPLLHYSFRTLADHFSTIDRFTRLAAEDLAGRGEGGSFVHLLVHPPATFIKSFFFRLGFLDGWRGLLIAALSARHSYLKYARARGAPREREARGEAVSEEGKPAVAVACSSPSWGGMEMQAVLSAAELAGRGYPVLFLARRGTPAEKEARERGLAVFPVLSMRYLAPLAVRRAARLLRRRAVRLVHAEYSKDLWTLVPAARLAGGIPVILTKRLASSVDKKDPVHRFLFARTTRVIAISSAIRENLLKRTTIPPDRIVTIPNGVDLGRFPAGASERAAVRAELGIPERAPLAGLVGRISRGKGHLDFLGAAAAIKDRIPGVRFLVVGSVTKGEERYAREVEAIVGEAGLDERVLFTGFREDIPRILSALDLLVVPSRSEAFGNVVLEGMAASLPVLACGEAGIRDIVVDGETGLLFPPGDREKLAAALVRILEHPALGREMGARGRTRAEDLFDRKKRTDRIEALYREVLDESRREAGGFPSKTEQGEHE